MPDRLTRFRDDWLELSDRNGATVKEWCSKGKDDYTIYCSLCKVSLNTGNSGQKQIMQHSSTKKHQRLQCERNDNSQSRLVFTEGQGVSLNSKASTSKTSWTLNPEDSVYKSEIIWIIHAALNNYSFVSHNGIKNVFSVVFPDSQICAGISLSSTKVSYSISHGLALYFLKQITSEFMKENPFFTLMFDETLNEHNLKQLDVYVRFWSTNSGGILERYLGTELLGHATALNVFNAIQTILRSREISLKRLIMLGSDGPNVNKSVFQLFNKEVQTIREHGLVNIGTCNLHTIHNAFGKGLAIEEFANIIDFLENIHLWFSKFPSRKEDFQNQIDSFGCQYSKVLRFVSNRWLSIVPVCERMLHLLPALKEYFLEDLPKNKSSLLKLDRYASIKRVLANPLLLAYLHFLINVGSMFEDILQLLQQKKTLIHILYDELSELVLKVMRRFINEEALKGRSGEKLLEVDAVNECVSLKSIDVGNKARKACLSLENKSKDMFLFNAKQFYIAVFEHLSKKLPLRNKLLQSLQVLHPIVRKEPITTTLPIVRRLCNILPQVIPEDSVDKVTDEWHIYISDVDINENMADNPIDKFWDFIFQLKNSNEKLRYPHLSKLVKAVLTFSHGQASVERGFSVNKRIVKNDKPNMSLDTIVGLRIIKDSIRDQAADIDVTKEMIYYYKAAHSKYKAQKEKENLEEMKRKKSLEPKLNQVPKQTNKDKLKGLKESILSAQAMIDEGSNRLKLGLKRQCMTDIEAAQALIDAGNKKLKTAQEETV